ncbi:MAG: hypothetical protein ABIQ91_03590 [Candidatus Paceibacterota bacterium]
MRFSAIRKPGAEVQVTINSSDLLSASANSEFDDQEGFSTTPIGTVIASVVDFETFSAKTKNFGTLRIFSPIKSKWAPCDGRNVVGSKYQIYWSGNLGSKLPDLRGLFLRGLNKFAMDEKTSGVTESSQNPDEPSTKFSVQKDMVGAHTHLATINTSVVIRTKGAGSGDSGDQTAPINPTITIKENNGKETRPKNISVYYYIRIN